MVYCLFLYRLSTHSPWLYVDAHWCFWPHSLSLSLPLRLDVNKKPSLTNTPFPLAVPLSSSKHHEPHMRKTKRDVRSNSNCHLSVSVLTHSFWQHTPGDDTNVLLRTNDQIYWDWLLVALPSWSAINLPFLYPGQPFPFFFFFYCLNYDRASSTWLSFDAFSSSCPPAFLVQGEKRHITISASGQCSELDSSASFVFIK